MEVELLSDSILTSPVRTLGVLRGLRMDQCHQSAASTADNMLCHAKWEFVKIGVCRNSEVWSVSVEQEEEKHMQLWTNQSMYNMILD